jgi:hypothetical protein
MIEDGVITFMCFVLGSAAIVKTDWAVRQALRMQ